MSGVIGGGGGGGGAAMGMGASGGGGCVFSCVALLSTAGAILALYDLDIGSESAFFAITGLGGLCFAKCQYIRLIEQRMAAGGLGFHKRYGDRPLWANNNSHYHEKGPEAELDSNPHLFGVRKKRENEEEGKPSFHQGESFSDQEEANLLNSKVPRKISNNSEHATKKRSQSSSSKISL